MTYKYPYLEPRMYAAVMGACSWIRESGYFNKAVRYYADKYGFTFEEVAEQVRKRQSIGQKAKSQRGRKYRYFVIEHHVSSDADGEGSRTFEVVKGISRETVENRFTDSDWRNTMANDYGGSYSLVFTTSVISNAFETKEEAEKFMMRKCKI